MTDAIKEDVGASKETALCAMALLRICPMSAVFQNRFDENHTAAILLPIKLIILTKATTQAPVKMAMVGERLNCTGHSGSR